jgi:hypothetical protein
MSAQLCSHGLHHNFKMSQLVHQLADIKLVWKRCRLGHSSRKFDFVWSLFQKELLDRRDSMLLRSAELVRNLWQFQHALLRAHIARANLNLLCCLNLHIWFRIGIKVSHLRCSFSFNLYQRVLLFRLKVGILPWLLWVFTLTWYAPIRGRLLLVTNDLPIYLV